MTTIVRAAKPALIAAAVALLLGACSPWQGYKQGFFVPPAEQSR
jgi:hypothetical protein